MNSPPKITINRALRVSWLNEALRLRAEEMPLKEALEQLETLLQKDISGKESIKKSSRYLRKIWLESSPHLKDLQGKAIELYRRNSHSQTASFLSLFMTLASYPFVKEVMEVSGRLFRLQGTIKTEQIKRKFTSTYGEREPVLRSTRYVVSLLADMGLLMVTETRGIYGRGNLSNIDTYFAAFALEAFLISVDNPSGISRQDLDNHPALFAFDAPRLVDLALMSDKFLITQESYNRELVELKP